MECPFYSWLYHYLLLSLLPSLGYWLQRRRQRDGGKLAHYTPRCCCCWTHPGVVDVTSFGSLFSLGSPCENVEKYIFKKKKRKDGNLYRWSEMSEETEMLHRRPSLETRTWGRIVGPAVSSFPAGWAETAAIASCHSSRVTGWWWIDGWVLKSRMLSSPYRFYIWFHME